MKRVLVVAGILALVGNVGAASAAGNVGGGQGQGCQLRHVSRRQRRGKGAGARARGKCRAENLSRR